MIKILTLYVVLNIFFIITLQMNLHVVTISITLITTFIVILWLLRFQSVQNKEKQEYTKLIALMQTQNQERLEVLEERLVNVSKG